MVQYCCIVAHGKLKNRGKVMNDENEYKPLDNAKLLAQCERIKVLISQASQTTIGKNMYGAHYHNYILKPPAPLKEIRDLEKKHNVSLPEEYVYFLNQVGSSGAGPGNGFIHDYKRIVFEEHPLEWINTPSEQLETILTDEEWDKRFGEGWYIQQTMGMTKEEEDFFWNERNKDEKYIPRYAGTICLTATDTTFQVHLIVTGKYRGKIVYMDWDGDCPPIWAKGCDNFLDWCENWFKEIVAGYTIRAGSFMYNEIGSEEELIDCFNQSDDTKYKTQVIYSFLKFPSLSDTAIDFLKNQQDKFEKAVTYVLENEGYLPL